MGMPQPGSPETSENAVSEGHDRPQRTSMESPKAAQPSCLRGGFICLFLKRTEQDRSLEDASSSNQSTEDKHGVRGKKRKVLSGNIFRLPCLRPAEKTEPGEQINTQVNKVDDQGNQATPEEELKPYSKASFLRKIRGYRLMRERDATEKEKVIEMDQCKEGSFAEEHLEKKLGKKVDEPKRYEDILGEKGKMSGEKESKEKMQGEKGSKILQQQRTAELSTDQGDSFRMQKSNDKNLGDLEETVNEKDNGGMNEGVKRNGKVEHKNPTNNEEELGNDLKEQENHVDMAKGHKDEDILGQESHNEIVEDLGNKVKKQEQTEGIPDQDNSIKNQEVNLHRVHELDNAAKDLPKNNLKMENEEKLENDLLEQESLEEKTGDIAKSSPRQDNNEERARTEHSEQKKDGELLKTVIDQESHAEIAEDTQKKEDIVEESVENLPKNKIQDEILGESENRLLDRDSSKEKENHLLEKEINVENVEEPENQTEKLGKADHSLEQDSHIQKEGKTVDQFIDQTNYIPKEEHAGDHLLEQHSYMQKKGTAGDQFLKKHSHLQKEEKAGDQFLEEDGHLQKEGKAGDQFLEKHSHLRKEKKAGDQFLEKDSHLQKEGKARDQFVEEDSHIQKEGKAEDHLLEQHSHIQKEVKEENQFVEEDSHIQKDEMVVKQFVQQDGHTEKKGKGRDQFPAENCHKQKDRKTDQSLEEDSQIMEEGKSGNQFLEEDSHIKKEGKAGDQFLEEDSHIKKEGKAGDRFLEEDSHIKKEGKAGDRFLEEDSLLWKGGNCLLDQNSNTESTAEPEALCLEQERHGNNLEKTKAQITEQDILNEGEANLPEENKCVKKCKGRGEVKDRSIKQGHLISHTTCTARSEEPHTEFSTFQEQESAPNTVDFTYYHQEDNQEDIKDGDDDVMEDAEWKSLQVEVKSMVQWLVEEASDRLECFSQEPQGTE